MAGAPLEPKKQLTSLLHDIFCHLVLWRLFAETILCEFNHKSNELESTVSFLPTLIVTHSVLAHSSPSLVSGDLLGDARGLHPGLAALVLRDGKVHAHVHDGQREEEEERHYQQ